MEQVMTHYLVDTENMGRDWRWALLGDEKYTRCHIFYTEHSPAISIEMAEYLVKEKNRLEFLRCCTGTNALDFQLVTLLGYMVSQEPEDQYYIVSKDTGFDAVVDFWTKRGMKVARISRELKELMPTCTLDHQIKGALQGIVDEKASEQILEIILEKGKERSPQYKTLIHTRLVKDYSQTKGREIYYACKDIMEQVYLGQKSEELKDVG